jgi:hypothetical protein
MQLLGILSWFEGLVDFITGFFAFIPMSIYFLYTTCVSFLDLLQYVMRKLAGLDVYYINGKAVEGDIVVSFIRGILGLDGANADYSVLSTTFWSLIVFSVILLVLVTIICIIKAHYNYDARKSQPMEIIRGAIKSLMTLAVVPIVTVFGVYMSQIILRYLDELTSASSGSNITALYGSDTDKMFESQTINGNKAYARYDLFGAGSFTTTTTFSGILFKLAGNQCNRVRSEQYDTSGTGTWTGFDWKNFDVFTGNDSEKIALKIDEAFASNLNLKSEYEQPIIILPLVAEDSFLYSAYFFHPMCTTFATTLVWVRNFAKFDVALVYYYYDLWAFNYFIAFAGIAALLTLMINIIMGLIQRLIMCIALFMVYSPLVAITPLDGGNAFKNWKKEFISNILMAYGAIVGMNLFFMILPFLNTISFFGSNFVSAHILDGIMNVIIIIAGLSVIKKFIKLLSGFIGAADANETGKSLADDTMKLGKQVAGGVMKAAGVGVAVGAGGMALNNKIFNASKKATKAEGKGKGFKKFMGGVGLALSGPGQLLNIPKNKHQNKVRKALGLSEDAKVTDKHEQQYQQMNTLKKLGNVDEKEIDEAFKSGDERNIQAAIDLNNEVANNNLKKAGKKEIKAEEGQIIGEGSNAEASKQGDDSKLKAFGKGMLDVGGASLKLAGEITGLSKFFKSFGDAGVFDEAKTVAAKFGQSMGMFGGGKPAALKTKKEKEDDDKKSAKTIQEAQASIAENTQKQLAEIQKLTRAINELTNKTKK